MKQIIAIIFSLIVFTDVCAQTDYSGQSVQRIRSKVYNRNGVDL